MMNIDQNFDIEEQIVKIQHCVGYVSITTKRLVAASFPNNKARDFEKCTQVLNAAVPPPCAVILTISGRVICELSPEMSKAIRKHPPYYLPVTETPVSLWL